MKIAGLIKTWGVVLLCGGLFFCLNKQVSAADSGGLDIVISPLPINLVTTPGSTVSAQLKVKNNGTKTESLQTGLMKFSAFGDNGEAKIVDREKGDDYFDWVKFSEDSFDLAPNEWKTITMTITVPQNAAFGYYYAATFSRKDSSGGVGARSTKIVGATAILVLLEVRVPQAVREITVLNFNAQQKAYEFLPVAFQVKLKNSGNVHVAPWGNIFISGSDDKEIAILPINDYKGNVLPNSNRIFEAEWRDGFPAYQQVIDGQKIEIDKNGNPIRKLTWDFSQANKLRFGKYTARLELIYDDGSRDIPVEGKLTFWVMPWRIMGAALLFVLLIGAGLWSLFANIFKGIFRRKKNEII